MKKFLSYLIYCWIIVLLVNCKDHQYCVSKEQIQPHHYVIKEQPLDSTMWKQISPYKQKIDADLNIIIAYNHQALEKNMGCCNLAQLVYESIKFYADSILNDSTPYSVLINYGGLRANIPKGNVTKRTIYELMPFDNSIVILELNDEQLQQLHSKTKTHSKLLLKPQSPATKILVTSDYLYQGGDDCGFLKSAKKLNSHTPLIRDIIIHYCTEKKELSISCFN